MASFRFSLQQVQDYREQLKDQAQVTLSRVQTEYLRERERSTSLEQQIKVEEKLMQGTALNDSGERWLREHFIKGLRDDQAKTLTRLRTLHDSLEEAKKTLTMRAKEHKVLEKLNAKQHERHRLNERLKEQRTYDETAAIRFKATTF